MNNSAFFLCSYIGAQPDEYYSTKRSTPSYQEIIFIASSLSRLKSQLRNVTRGFDLRIGGPRIPERLFGEEEEKKKRSVNLLFNEE